MNEKELELARSKQKLRQLEKDVLALKEIIHNYESDIVKSHKRQREFESERLSTTKKQNHLDGLGLLEDLLTNDDQDNERIDLTKPYNHLQEQYETMKERMSLQADEIKIYRDRVLRLQDQLIQKNDNEKRFLKKSSAGVKSSMKQSGSGNYSNDDLEKQLEDRITKVRSLEEAYRKQEKVIEKMELLIRQQNLSRVKKLESKISALESENSDLKKEVSDLKKLKNKNQFDQKQQHQHEKDRKNNSDADKNDDDDVRGDVTNDRNRNDTKRVNGLKMNGNLDNSRKFQKQTNVQDDDDADFSLKNKYEEAETRIKELEKQLSEATKMWSNEKTDLVAKLRNAEHSLYE